MNSKIFNEDEIKKKFLYLVFFIAIILAFYFFILNKIFYIVEIKNKIEDMNIYISNLKRDDKRTDEKIKVLKKEVKILNGKEKTSHLENIPFKDISSLEIFIEKYLKKNNLFLNVIGRLEEDENTSKIYIPYEIFGDIGNLLNFFYDLEIVMADISFGETPFLIKLEGQNIYQGKIKSSIEVNQKVISGNFYDFFQRNFEDRSISQIKIFSFNNKKYITVYYFEGGRSVFSENQLLKVNDKSYRILIKENSIYLEENNGEQK